mgnify:CR=1 FL=1
MHFLITFVPELTRRLCLKLEPLDLKKHYEASVSEVSSLLKFKKFLWAHQGRESEDISYSKQ